VNVFDSVSPDARALRALFLGPPRWTLAVAESLTCGRLQAAIGAVPGASDFFLGGITAYSLEQKIRHLAVDENEAVANDGVSSAVVQQMASGACGMFGSDFAVATTGYAEPNLARGIVHPIAYWALARKVGNQPSAVIRDGCIERPGLDRVAMQIEVVREVLAALGSGLRSLR